MISDDDVEPDLSDLDGSESFLSSSYELIDSQDEEILSDTPLSPPLDLKPCAEFDSHLEAVFSCEFLNVPEYEGVLVVSGGKDEQVYFWEPKSDAYNETKLEIVEKISSHSESIAYTRVNSNHTLLATADVSGIVKVFCLKSEDSVSNKISILEISTSETDGEILWLEWHASLSNVLLAGTSFGNLWMFGVLGSQKSLKCKVFPHSSSCLAGTLLIIDKGASSQTNAFACSYEDGVIKAWNLAENNLTPLYSSCSVKEALCCLDSRANIIVSGSASGTVFIFNKMNGDNLAKLSIDSLTEEVDAGVECIKFCPSSPCIAVSCHLDGSLVVWDISYSQVRHNIPTHSGVLKMIWLKSNASIFLTSHLNGFISVCDSKTGTLLYSKQAHYSEIYDFHVSFDERFLLTASEDSCCRLFNFAEIKNQISLNFK